jgi:hypothetical protein
VFSAYQIKKPEQNGFYFSLEPIPMQDPLSDPIKNPINLQASNFRAEFGQGRPETNREIMDSGRGIRPGATEFPGPGGER